MNSRTTRTGSANADPPGRASAGTASGISAGSALAAGPSALSWSHTPAQLRMAIGLAVLGGLLCALAPSVGLVADGPGPGFASTGLLVLVACVPPALAAVLVSAGRAATAAAVLVGFALFALGRVLTDLQLAVDALQVSRPELFAPTSLAPLSPGAGLWMMLGGHLAALLAGVLALGRAGATEGVYLTEIQDPRSSRSLAARRRAVGLAIGLAAVVVTGLVVQPFGSDDAFQLAHDLLGSPLLVLFGGLLVAAAAAGGMVSAAVSRRATLARGLALGVWAGVLTVAVPPLVAGLATARLHPSPGPYLALAGVTAFLALLWWPESSADTDEATVPDELSLESGRLHRAAGALGALVGIGCLFGAFGAQLVVGAGIEAPVAYLNRSLLPVGVLLVVLGIVMALPRVAASVRPALIVSLAAVPMVGAGVLQWAFTASGFSDSDSVRVGGGVWATAAAVFVAAVAACVGAIAGAVERDEAGVPEYRPNLAMIAVTSVAVALALGAFALPTVDSAQRTSPAIAMNFQPASWGLLIALATVVVAALAALRARPGRGAALLLGAAAVVGVHLLDRPLTGFGYDTPRADQGTMLSAFCLLALLIAAGIAAASRREPVSAEFDVARQARRGTAA